MNESMISGNPNELLPIAQAGLDDAGRINYYNDLARAAGCISIKAAIGAGIELRRVQQRLPGGFSRWVEDNCKFSRSTAYNYIALAGSLLAQRPIEEIEQVEAMDATERADYVTSISGATDGRSLSALYSDYGIVRRSKMGGKREGAGRKRKDSACLSMQEREDMATVELRGLVAQLGEFFQRRRHLYLTDKAERDTLRLELVNLAGLLE